jgi:two-component system, NtrC family, response regulator AtoC
VIEDTPETQIRDPSTRTQPDAHEDAPGCAHERRHLLVFNGSSSWIYQLPVSGSVVIGRSEAADLRIDDPSISRQHAKLVVLGDTITLTDLGSQNGTLVNHQRIEGPHLLRPNDVVAIQKATILLHAHSVANRAAVELDPEAFRQRLEAEIDRAVRYERAFSVLCIVWDDPVDRRANERTVGEQLRRIDATSWMEDGVMHVLLAEVSGEAASAVAARIRDKQGASVRIGQASCPSEGYDVDTLLTSSRRAAHGAAAGTVASTVRAYDTLTIGSQRVIVADPAMARLYALVERLAPVDLPILIIGETGCGKELVANAVHHYSRRSEHTLVSLNCAAIQETLVESELFGHERGAFSGAVASKPGLIEAASGSTLFLDEIGELSLSIQAKLLRVLEMQRVTRVGDIRERSVDVRIVAATNRDLEEEVEAGRFRRDLFFRLSAAQLVLPPLRQRPRELPLLATAFLEEACGRAGRNPMSISESAMTALLEHAWSGNVRELKNLMQYVAAAHHTDVLTAEHVAERLTVRTRARSETGVGPLASRSAGFRPLGEEIRELEAARIREALEAAGFNQTRAASLLGMPVRTFFEKVKQYGLTPKKKR